MALSWVIAKGEMGRERKLANTAIDKSVLHIPIHLLYMPLMSSDLGEQQIKNTKMYQAIKEHVQLWLNSFESYCVPHLSTDFTMSPYEHMHTKTSYILGQRSVHIAFLPDSVNHLIGQLPRDFAPMVTNAFALYNCGLKFSMCF